MTHSAVRLGTPEKGGLRVEYRQRGHQSVYAGANEFAQFNRRADTLAGQAGSR